MTGVTIESLATGHRARLQLAVIRALAFGSHITDGRGLGRAVEHLGRILGRDNYVVLGLAEGRRLKVDLHDGYWLAPLLAYGAYESEVESILRSTLLEDALFVDCGANIGYWSVIATKWIRDPKRIIAVEASTRVFPRLVENSSFNSPGFTCVNGVAWSESGTRLPFSTDPVRHAWGTADRTIRSELRTLGFKETGMPSVAVDDLVRDAGGEPRLVVLKVDVEGSETKVLEGAHRTLHGNAVVIYEEHGRNARAAATKLLQDRFGMKIFACGPSPETDGVVEVSGNGTIKDASVDKKRGYNYVAVRPGTRVHSDLVQALARRP